MPKERLQAVTKIMLLMYPVKLQQILTQNCNTTEQFRDVNIFVICEFVVFLAT